MQTACAFGVFSKSAIDLIDKCHKAIRMRATAFYPAKQADTWKANVEKTANTCVALKYFATQFVAKKGNVFGALSILKNHKVFYENNAVFWTNRVLFRR